MKTNQLPNERESNGEFERQQSTFRDWVRADGSGDFPAASRRYHLYVSLACPWAHRTVIARRILGLESAIGMTVVDPILDDRGWAFRQGPGHTKDPVSGFEFLSKAYKASNPAFAGRVTVPVLWDRETHRIVNNESSEILRMLHSEFGGVAPQSQYDLYPAAHRDEIDAVNTTVYDNVNNGVYRAGFATTQEAYENAVRSLFETLDALDDRLSDRRYLVGDGLTEADIRLFVTLVRFDAVYVEHFKCNVRRIADYDHLSGYLRDLYQHQGFGATANFDHIKRHYYESHHQINPNGIVPLGPTLDLDAPHDRASLSA